MKYSLISIIIALFVAIFFVGCKSLEEKSVAGTIAVDGVKMETAGGATTGTPMPNVMLGEVTVSGVTSKPLADTEKSVTTMSLSVKTGWFGSKTVSMSLSGNSNDSSSTKDVLFGVANIISAVNNSVSDTEIIVKE